LLTLAAVFHVLVQLTAADQPPGALAETVQFFSRLCGELPAAFLASPRLHAPLARLIRICTGDAQRGPRREDTQSDESSSSDDEESAPVAVKAGSAEERALVELLCKVASRLRNTPELLPVFFREKRAAPSSARADAAVPARPASPAESTASAETVRATDVADDAKAPRASTPPPARTGYDFALLSNLLRYAHREEQTGELARSGLFFLFSRAFAPTHNLRRRRVNPNAERVEAEDESEAVLGRALAAYILEGDFADVLGAGLGAVYGLLPPRICIKEPGPGGEQSDAGSSMLGAEMSLGLGLGSDEQMRDANRVRDGDLVESTSPEVQTHLRTLTELLGFVQHILRTAHAASLGADAELARTARALKTRLADAVRKSFLCNLLSPTLLECTDADGSAVAVLSYLDVLLNAIDDDGPLADLIIGWLVGDSDAEGSTGRLADNVLTLGGSATARRRARRKSYALDGHGRRGSTMSTGAASGDDRYDLRDFIVDNLSADKRAATTAAALRLTSTLLSRHGRFTIEGFLSAEPDDHATAFPFPFPEALPEDDLDDDSSDVELAATPRPGLSIAQHMHELDIFLSLASVIEHGSGSAASSKRTAWTHSYSQYLQDAEDALVRESTYIDGVRAFEAASAKRSPAGVSEPLRLRASSLSTSEPPSPWQEISDLQAEAATSAPFPHRLAPPDRVLQALLHVLSRFFQHTPAVNVALTGVLASLALCPYRSLEGWLVFERGVELGPDAEAQGDAARPPTGASMTRSTSGTSSRSDGDSDDDSSGDEEEHELAQLASFWGRGTDWTSRQERVDSSAPAAGKRSAPVVLALLRSLVSQVSYYRATVPGFDALLAERRRGLTYVDNLSDAIAPDSLTAGLDGLSEKSEAMPSASVPAGLRDERRLWESLGVQLEKEELSNTSLPLPPSATASVGQRDAPRTPGSETEAEPELLNPKRASGFARWFGGRINLAAAAAAAAAASATGAPSSPNLSARAPSPAAAPVMPFAQHYTHTAGVLLEARAARYPQGSWGDALKSPAASPATSALSGSGKRTRFAQEGTHDGGRFVLPGVDEAAGESSLPRKAQSLSCLLDNVVILEECIKELVAIIQVRRGAGIDALRLTA
jgi:hypothetical protein